MNVVIIENEKLAAERLQHLIKAYDATIVVQACLNSIEQAVTWLRTKPHPDLLLADIELRDGSSFDIFKRVNVQKPVIFTTACENYALDAFQFFSVDYLLKPVTQETLAGALNKYRNLAAVFFSGDYMPLPEQTRETVDTPYRNRFLAKVGQRSFFVRSQDVSCFIADNKIVSLVDCDGNRYNINYTLEKLVCLLDPRCFFRINRKMIIHSNAIEQVKPYHNNRLKIGAKGFSPDTEIIVSRDRVSRFKLWAEM